LLALFAIHALPIEHHYRTISYEKALKAIQQLDRLVERELQIEQAKLNTVVMPLSH
jgi:hypothetical protein